MLHIQAMDHIVLVVDDVERSLAWYGGVLGLEMLRADEWRKGGVLFPSVRISGETIIDLLSGHRPRGQGNVDHLCLVIEETDLEVLRDSGTFDVVEGPVTRWGARGDGTSLYVKDPDGNIVELRHYGTRQLS